ncbi:MAG TPA: hypothetical protein VJZ00_06740 [Thermoanaerobaculia bacterium]|nr:hypothetical protein [Thermoanaerobaculia bacterium]
MRIAPRTVAYTLFLSVFAALCISNFALRRQLDTARLALRTASMAPAMRPMRFRVGDVVPGFQARDRSTKLVTLGGKAQTPSKRMLALVHPQCKYCVRLLDEIAKTPRVPSNLAIVSLTTLEKSAEVTQRTPPGVATYFVDHVSRTPIATRAGTVPQLLLVNAEGKVSEVCSGFAQCAQHAQLQ